MAAAERSSHRHIACHGCISPKVAAHLRECVNTQPLGGWQKQKPVGDNSRWRNRDSDTSKYITNQRKGFKHELKRAVAAFDVLPAEPTQELLNDASQELQRCYRKLLFPDKYGIVINKKVDGPEVQIIMTPQQIAHNNSLRAEDNSPMIDT